MARRTAFLHWCDAQNTSKILGRGAINDGKEVRMRADWLDGYQQPTGFEVHEEAFFLRRLVQRLGGQWHPMAPFVTETKTPGFTVSRDTWTVRTSKVSKQSSYYFTDDQRNRSGRLPVTDATHYVTQSGLSVDEVHGEVKAHGVGMGLTVSGFGGNKRIVHGVRATTDPVLLVDQLTPHVDAPINLLGHVQRLLLEQFYPDQQRYADDYPDVPAELSFDALIEAADGYLDREPTWWPTVSYENGYELVVDEFRSAEISLDIPDPAINWTFRTAYALQLTDANNPDNFVISDIVLVDGDGDSIRVRG